MFCKFNFGLKIFIFGMKIHLFDTFEVLNTQKYNTSFGANVETCLKLR